MDSPARELLSVATIAGLLFASGLAPTASGAAENTTPTLPAARRVNVEILTLVPQDLAVTATYVGDLQPNERVVLRSETEGLIQRVTFDESDVVKKGQVLANIATDQAVVRRDQAKASLDLAQATADRNQALFDKQLIPPQTLDDSRTALEVARLNLRAAELEVQKSMVLSPLDGVVKTRHITQGEFAQRGGLVAEILDLHVMVAKINAPEREVVHITPGKLVTVWLDALPGRTFPGRVTMVGPEADSKSRTFPVEVEVENKDRTLRAGMLARVKAPLISASRQVVIPRSAVLERERSRIVYVEEGGVARVRTVELGAATNDQVQVLSGLGFGDRLILVGQARLSPGDPVLVIRSSSQPAEPKP